MRQQLSCSIVRVQQLQMLYHRRCCMFESQRMFGSLWNVESLLTSIGNKTAVVGGQGRSLTYTTWHRRICPSSVTVRQSASYNNTRTSTYPLCLSWPARYVPRYQLTTYEGRSFICAAAAAWNSTVCLVHSKTLLALTILFSQDSSLLSLLTYWAH